MRRGHRIGQRVGPILLAVLLGAGGGSLGVGAGIRPSEAIALTANPTSGEAPLLVQFQLSHPSGTPPALAWSFGDGTYLNGSAAPDWSPSHAYLNAGTFDCVVTLEWPTGPVHDTIAIHVTPANVTVRASAAPNRGDAPLTVWLNASVLGGTGTFLSYNWSFGNGASGSGLSVRYTYPAPGDYAARFTAVDTAGRAGSAAAVVTVLDPNGSPDPSGGGTSARGALFGGPAGTFGVVVGAGAAVGLVAYFWTRRYRSAVRRNPPEPVPPAPPSAPSAIPPSPATSPPGPLALDAPPGSARPTEPAFPARIAPPAPGLATPSRITDALVRHLGGLPKLWPNDLPSKAWTQAGIAEAIGAGQSAVSRVLRRLVAAGIIAVETRHVEGSVRRLRIYRLTERGERLGRALREIPRPGTGAAATDGDARTDATGPPTSRGR